MTDLEDTPLDDLDRPVPRRRRRVPGGFSAESLLASILAHLAVVFLVIVLAPNRSADRHDGPVFDLTQFVLPEASAVTDKASPDAPVAVPRPAPEAGAPVEIPARDDEPVEEAAAAPSEEPPPQETVQAPAEPSPPNAEVADDPVEEYVATVASLVEKVSYQKLRIRAHFTGEVTVHLTLNALGMHVRPPEVCRDQDSLLNLYTLFNMGPEAAYRAFIRQKREIEDALVEVGRYPPWPPGVDVPRVLTFIFPLGPIPEQYRTN